MEVDLIISVLGNVMSFMICESTVYKGLHRVGI